MSTHYPAGVELPSERPPEARHDLVHVGLRDAVDLARGEALQEGELDHDVGGAIHVFKGSARGVTIAGNTMVTSGNVDGRVMDVQACAGGSAGADNKANTVRCTRKPFGWSVRTGRFHGGKYADVIAGIGDGKLLVLRGGPLGIDKRRLKTLALPGITGTSTRQRLCRVAGGR